jgi:hypothetical protein
LVLDVKQGSSSVIISEAHGGPNQLWDFEGDGTIRNKLGFVMDVCQEKTQPFTPVIVHSKHGRWNQIFRTVLVG